jgi:hypothetical protein
MSSNSTLPRTRRWASLGAACLLVTGIAGTTIAGIQGSGVRRLAAFGTVDTQDGIKVNGVTYDATGARIVINGKSADVSRIHSGHIVAVKGSIASGETSATMDALTLVSDVRGQVTQVDERAGAVQILGQTVYVTSDSVLDPSIQPSSIGGLHAGMFVTVSGFARSDGSFVASSIDVDATAEIAQVRGVVQALDAQGHSLRIGHLLVDYSSASIMGVIAEGAVVTVQGAEVTTGSLLAASSIEVFAGIGSEGELGDLEGIITAFASATDFEVNGQPVLADANTQYILHGVTLGTDVRVRVRGKFDAAGILVADKIQADAPKSSGKGKATTRGKGPKTKGR